MINHSIVPSKKSSAEHGVALILVMLIILILTVTSTAIMFTVQTDTVTSTNYKYANQCFYVADAGIQKCLDWFNNTYTPHQPASDYDSTVVPVRYDADNVILAGQTGMVSHYPDSGTASSFTTALANQAIAANSDNSGTYAVNATLIKARGVHLLFGAVSTMERWKLDSVGLWGANTFPLGTGRVSAVIENAGAPFFATALWGRDFVNLSGGAITDSYNPDLGPYGGTNVGQKGSIGTNGSIILGGSSTRINGDAAYLPPGTYTATGGALTTGSVIALSQPRIFPPIPPFNTGVQNINLSGGSLAISPGAYGNITVSGNAVLILNPGTYYINSFTISSASSSAQVNGAVTLYIQSGMNLSGNSITNPSQNPTNLVIYDNGTTGASISGNSGFYGLVYAPNDPLTLSGGGQFYGAFIAKNITNSGGAGVHYDENLSDDFVAKRPFRIVNTVRGDF